MAYTRNDVEVRVGSPDLNAVGVFGTNTAIDFTTTPSGVKIAVPNGLDMTVLTMMFWAYTHAHPDAHMGVIGWNPYYIGGDYPSFRLLFNGTSVKWITHGGITGVLEYAFNPLQQWDHFCVTRDKTLYKLYINGILVAQETLTGARPVDTVTSGYIDIGSPGYFNGTNYYCGKVDDLMVSRSIVVDSNFSVPNKSVKLLYPNVDWLIDLSNSGGSPPSSNNNNILKVY